MSHFFQSLMLSYVRRQTFRIDKYVLDSAQILSLSLSLSWYFLVTQGMVAVDSNTVFTEFICSALILKTPIDFQQ